MLTYIYFVKCPGCEDEPFDFFDEAKEFAFSCLSRKPVITQTEVDRNDFGECVDSCDLGTVWSWEEAIGREVEDTEANSVFTKDDLKLLTSEQDPEFDNLDNSLDFDTVEDAIDFLVKDEEEAIAGYKKVEDALDGFDVKNKKEILDTINHIKEEEEEHIEELKAVGERKPVPEGMTIEQLVEAMEKNEDDVECKSCSELFDKSECRHDADYGWLCSRCQRAIEDHGAALTLTEASKYKDSIELHYDELTAEIITKVIPATLEEPAEPVEGEYTDEFDFEVATSDVEQVLWDNLLTDEDVEDVPGGLDALEDEATWKAFLETHFDDLLEKYNDELLKFFKEDAEEAAREVFQSRYEDQRYDESFSKQAMKEELKWNTYKITYTTAANPDKEQTTTFKTWKFDVEYAWRMSRENIPHSTIKRIELVEGLSESINPNDLVELEYPSLTVTLYGEKRTEDDWDEFEHTDSHVYLVPKVEVATAIWENWITEEDAEDVLGGLKTLEDDRLWELYLETHFDDLFEKYNQQILEYFKEDATEDFRERSQEESQLNNWSVKQKRAYAALEDDFNESTQKPFLEEFSDAETHKASLTDCPECGSVSYDIKEQYCTNCGLNL